MLKKREEEKFDEALKQALDLEMHGNLAEAFLQLENLKQEFSQYRANAEIKLRSLKYEFHQVSKAHNDAMTLVKSTEEQKLTYRRKAEDLQDLFNTISRTDPRCPRKEWTDRFMRFKQSIRHIQVEKDVISKLSDFHLQLFLGQQERGDRMQSRLDESWKDQRLQKDLIADLRRQLARFRDYCVSSGILPPTPQTPINNRLWTSPLNINNSDSGSPQNQSQPAAGLRHASASPNPSLSPVAVTGSLTAGFKKTRRAMLTPESSLPLQKSVSSVASRAIVPANENVSLQVSRTTPPNSKASNDVTTTTTTATYLIITTLVELEESYRLPSPLTSSRRAAV